MERTETNNNYADKNGYTFDPTTNVLANLVARNKDLPQRFDRIVVRGHWVPKEMSRIGLDPEMEEDGKSCLASDHYGLLCRLAYDNKGVLRINITRDVKSCVPANLIYI